MKIRMRMEKVLPQNREIYSMKIWFGADFSLEISKTESGAMRIKSVVIILSSSCRKTYTT